MPFFAPNARFLGRSKITSSNTDTPIIVIPDDIGFVFGTFTIAGYSASQVALIRLGTTETAVDSGTTYSCWTASFAAAAVTGASRPSTTGVWVAHTAQTNRRQGSYLINNSNGEVKTITTQGVDYSASSVTAATGMADAFTSQGLWITTAKAKSIRLNSGGAGTLNAGTFIDVYGAPGG